MALTLALATAGVLLLLPGTALGVTVNDADELREALASALPGDTIVVGSSFEYPYAISLTGGGNVTLVLGESTVTVRPPGREVALAVSDHSTLNLSTTTGGLVIEATGAEGVVASSNSIVTVTSVKDATTHTVTFDSRDGSAVADKTALFGTAITKPADPTRPGYTFGGWYTEAGCINVWNFATKITADRTLYAKWAPIPYSITYDLAGGAVSPANPATYNVETATFALSNPTRSGHVFLGWSGTGITGISTDVTIAKGSTGARSYTAKWGVFKDVSTDHAYYKAIAELSARKIINGFSDGTFGPAKNVIRQQFTKMILGAVGISVTRTETLKFKDVPRTADASGYPYYFIARCVAAKIIAGYSDNTFRPAANMTRAQLITMVVRAAETRGLIIKPAGATPFGRFDSTHYGNAAKAYANGLLTGLQGMGSGYNFYANATRGETAQVLYNYLQLRANITTAFFEQAKKLYYYEEARRDRYWQYHVKYPTRAVSTIVWQVNVNLDAGFFNRIEAVRDPFSLTALVNKNFKLSSSYVPKLARIDSASLRPEAATALAELKKAAKAGGIYVYAYTSGYRSYATQASIYASKAGMATRDKWHARPGHSEHQTGLAIDVTNSAGAKVRNTKEGTWLRNNSWKYGFIVRYTAENTGITGYNPEPWHLRFIGKEHAKKMHDLGIQSYEEYWVKYVAHRP